MLPLRPFIHHIHDAARTDIAVGSLSSHVCVFLSCSAQLHRNLSKLRIPSRSRMLMSTQVEYIVTTTQAFSCLHRGLKDDLEHV